RLRSVYKYEIFNDIGELATTGSTVFICFIEDTFKPIRLDSYFPDWHEAYSIVKKINNEWKTVEIMVCIDYL
ncbi:acyl-CoA thioesterase, partial [Staphylococcus aureus]|nr:acyl-CoA thioesterase [Staphylococcus aureus]